MVRPPVDHWARVVVVVRPSTYRLAIGALRHFRDVVVTVTVTAALSFAVIASTAPPLPSLAVLRGAIASAPSERVLPSVTDPPLQQVWTGIDATELHGQKGCGNVGGDSADISSEVPCTFGDRSATRTVVVVGDSMAGAWVPTLDVWGLAEHWRIVRLVKDGCPPWTTPTHGSACLAFRSFEVQTINALQPRAVFAVGLQDRGQVTMETTKPEVVAATIEGFAEEIRPSRARVLVPQNTPWFFGIGSPLQCLAAYPGSVQRCNRDARTKVVEPAMLDGIAIAAAAHRVVEVPVDQLFCGPTVCPVLVGDHVVYADDHHFSKVWAIYISRAFGVLFDPLV